MSRLSWFLVLSLAMVACQQQPAVVDSTIPIPTVTTLAPVAESTTTAPTIVDTDDDGCFDAEPPLVGDGFLGRFEAQDSDSQALAGFNWSETDDCAAVTLSFRTEAGAPAVDPPEFRAEYLRHTAVVRLELGPEVVDAAVSDQALDTNLLATAYVAYEPAAAALVVDIHLATGSEVRVRPASSPARIILELEGDGRPVAGSATAGEAVIVFAPASSTPPLVVQGYGRSGIEISASFVSSTRAIEDTIFFEPSPTRWTTFDWTIRDFQPGPVAIRVGDAAPIEFISQ
jgi:hypothetical protein